MPIPKPKSGESENAYIGRCMRELEGDDKPQEQKLAMCFDTFRKVTKDRAMEQLRKAAKVITKAVQSAEISGSTTLDDDHWHNFEVDVNGDGMTTITVPESFEPHFHVVSNFKVDTENGHTHELNR